MGTMRLLKIERNSPKKLSAADKSSRSGDESKPLLENAGEPFFSACKSVGFAPKLTKRFFDFVLLTKNMEPSKIKTRELTELLVRFSKEERRANQEFYASNRETLETAFNAFCAQRNIEGNDKEKFYEYVEEKLQENLWEKTGHWRVAVKQTSYLKSMLNNMRKNSLGVQNGFFNSSTDAKRLGPLAIEMEKKLNMFGFSKTETVELLLDCPEHASVMCLMEFSKSFPKVEKPPKKGVDFPIYSQYDEKTKNHPKSKRKKHETTIVFLENLYNNVKHKPLNKKRSMVAHENRLIFSENDETPNDKRDDERWTLLRKYAKANNMDHHIIALFGFFAQGLENAQVDQIMNKPPGWSLIQLKQFHLDHGNKITEYAKGAVNK